MDYPEITIIVSCGRSGTSYVQTTLNESMDIGFCREPKFIIPLYQRLSKFGNLAHQRNLHRLVDEIFAGYITRIKQKNNIIISRDEIIKRIKEPTYSSVLYAIFELVAEKQGKTKLGYKFPGDILHLPTLSKIFPTARFVHVIRDGRDVALSLLRMKWGPTNLYAGCRYWARRTAIGKDDGISLGDRYFEFRFEDLLLKTELVGEALGKFINGGCNPKQVQGFVNQINNTKNTEIVYGWINKLDKKQRYLCEAAIGELLQAYGYTIEFGGEAKISSPLSSYYLVNDFVIRSWAHITKQIRVR